MLNKEEILKRTNNGLSIFKHYITAEWRLGRNFFNPLYEDSKASCNIYFDRKSGTYRMKDFGNDDYSGDCFSIVGKLKGLDCSNATDFIKIMEHISCDLGLSLSDNTPINSKPVVKYREEVEREKKYKVVEKHFSNLETELWGQYGISCDVLQKYNVVSLEEFRSETSEAKPFTIISSSTEPMFGYLGKRFAKIYRPLSALRFLYGGNVENYCFGLEQLPSRGDILFITGGEKDVMSLAARGFNAICFNSETANISRLTIQKLSYMFKHIVLLYDMDKTGQASSLKHQQQLAEFDVKRLLLPLPGTKEAKDISDYFRLKNSPADFEKLFLDLLDNLYSDTMTLLKSCEVDFNHIPPEEQVIVSAADVPLGTQGNLLCITGGEGTGKSNYVCSLVAGAIANENSIVESLGTTVCLNTKGKAVLLYDTEQSNLQLYKNIYNILKRSQIEVKDMPDYFKAYCLIGMSRKQRLQSITESMDRFYHQYKGIQMVVIDGIADLIRCANDESESIAIVEELYRLAGIYKTCIVCVLHFIPNGMKLRGHLGSELQRKAAAILSIEKDNDSEISVVKAMKVRDGSPLDVPLMQFSWDKIKGMHTYVGEKPKEEKEKRKENELASVAKNLFNKHHFFTYIDLCEQLQSTLDVKERTAKSYIRFMREKDIIIKDPSNSSYFIIGQL